MKEVRTEELMGTEESTFDTQHKPEMTVDQIGFAKAILAQNDGSAARIGQSRCATCRRTGVKVSTPRIGRGRPRSSACILVKSGRDAVSTQGEGKVTGSRTTGKLIKLFRCFFCNEPRSVSNMS